jgi:hypothetical protein
MAAGQLAVGQQASDFFHVRIGNNLVLTKTAFPLGGLLCQNMAGMGFTEFVLFRSRFF